MNLFQSSVGNGVGEITSVGNARDAWNGGVVMDAKTWLRGVLKDRQTPVVASLASWQGNEGRQFLLNNGFVQCGEYKRNPNTGHMIGLFVWTPPKPSPKKKTTTKKKRGK